MGGLSSQNLMHPTVSRPGDFVENCLENLSEKRRHRRDEDHYGYNPYGDEEEGIYFYHKVLEYIIPNGEQEETTTIVGTHLHGPTFDENYEEESEEVSSSIQ